MARVLAIEPFYGGSHRAFIDGLAKHSSHEFRMLTMPACFWKWRMRGAAITLADRARQLDFEPDIILASDMPSLAEFKSLYGMRLPAIIYMHENQLSYPVPEADQRDVHFGFTNITSCLAADVIVWNSHFHMNRFLAELSAFIGMMPDARPVKVAESIAAKSLVMYPGVDLASIDAEPMVRDGGPPIILWNHRWEFDKRPEIFFEAAGELMRANIDFRLAILGENFQAQPTVFLDARERFGSRMLQFGWAERRADYVRWLRRSSISVSTAEQENFGIAAVEAAYAGALPLWPDRLSYPELIPEEVGSDHLYSDFSELVLKLKQAVKAANSDRPEEIACAKALCRFDWSRLIQDYDELIAGKAG